MKELVVHIGYPKTASTFLQQEIFPCVNNYQLIDNRNFSEMLGAIYWSEAEIGGVSLAKFRNDLTNSLEIENVSNLILSSESFLSCSMYFNPSKSGSARSTDPSVVAQNIFAITNSLNFLDNIKILISIRRHEDLLRSFYTQLYNYCFRHYKKTKNFDGFLKTIFGSNRGFYLQDALDYGYIYEIYAHHFGAENVYVIPYELLNADISHYTRVLSEVFEQDLSLIFDLKKHNVLNRRSDGFKYKTDERNFFEMLHRHRKRIFPSVNFGLSNTAVGRRLKRITFSGRDLRLEIDSLNAEAIHRRYDPGLHRLASQINVDLNDLGYLGEAYG